MSIRFAAARPANTAHFGIRSRSLGAFRAANDNDGGIANSELLREALHHFARHGLGAAQRAGEAALAARRRGDLDACRHWLEVCRTLDRRMAAGLAVKLDRT